MWYVPIVLYIVLINTVYPWYRKMKLIHAKDVKFTTLFTLHYFFAALYAWIVIVLFGEIQINKIFWLITCVGAANGFAAYCQWRSDQISVSSGALFGFMHNVISIGLGFVLLNETEYLGPGISVGLALCASTTVILAIGNYYKKKTGKDYITPRFFAYVLGYTSIWGVAIFLMRYWAIGGVPITQFAVSWYTGAFMMSLVIFIINKIRGIETTASEDQAKNPPTLRKTLFMTSTAGALISGSIFLAYWALQLAPLTVVGPILFVSGLVPPLLVGMYLCGEKNQYVGIENILLVQAVLGAIFIALSFSG